MDIKKIEQYLESVGQPSYRAGQITDGYFSGNFGSFLDMSNLPKDLRQKLSENIEYRSLSENKLIKSGKSHKVSLKLRDARLIESVLMKYRSWKTVCVSTQVGCAMGCQFCATGRMGFIRNLTAEEIVDQIIYWRQKKHKVSRVVFMGMGEPFLNWDEVHKAINIIHDQIGIGWRKMSISTVGVIDGINKLTEVGIEVNLAISLHSVRQTVRQTIMPSGSKYQLKDILSAVRNYTAKIKRPVFFEYALMRGINDSEEDAADLAQLMGSNRLFFLNMIGLNRVKHSTIKPTGKGKKARFLAVLNKSGTKYSQRASLGGEIEAACGQLMGRG